MLHRGRRIARGQRRSSGPELELAAFPGVGLEGRRPPPERRRASVLAATLEQVRQVPERARAAGPLGQQERELVARVLHATEALLEDRRATQANGAKHLLLLRLAAQAIGATRKMVRELVVLAALDDGRLDRLIGLLVLRIQGQDTLPSALARGGVAAALVRARQPLEHGDAPARADAHRDGLQGRDPRDVVARDLGHALERAPAFERLGVELARLRQRAHRSRLVSARFAPLGDLGPVVRARRRRRRLARGVPLHAGLDVGAPPGRVPRDAQLALDGGARRPVRELDRALEERRRLAGRALCGASARDRDDGLDPTRPRDALGEARLELGGSAHGGIGLEHRRVVVRLAEGAGDRRARSKRVVAHGGGDGREQTQARAFPTLACGPSAFVISAAVRSGASPRRGERGAAVRELRVLVDVAVAREGALDGRERAVGVGEQTRARRGRRRWRRGRPPVPRGAP